MSYAAVRQRGKLQAGPASLEGLRWLARVGPSPLDAWAVAMGWAPSTAYSHAARLVRAGWVQRSATMLSAGSLLSATRPGVAVCQVEALPVWSEPAAASWGHLRACAWTAAWLSARGRVMVGSRELLLDDGWRREVEWLEHSGLRRRGHRPDLLAGMPGAGLLPIEVELARKSTPRLRSILALHATWIAAGKTGAVIYICGTEKGLDRVVKYAGEVGLGREQNTLRVELLADIRQQAIAARRGDG